MQNLTMLETRGPISPDMIKGVENSLTTKFPEEYKNFLMIYNGGYPLEEVFPMLEQSIDGENIGGIGRFFGINRGVYSDLLKVNAEYVGRMPEELFAIADNSCGDLICLCMRGPNFGKIYFWDHNWEEEKPTYRNVYLIAHSFTEFINSLRPPSSS